MWRVVFGKRTGVCHLKNGMKCQDQIISKKRGIYQCIVLADGAGNQDINILCVKEVINQTADNILHIISNPTILNSGKQNIVRSIMRENVHIISKYMELYHLPANDLASTLAGVAINTETGEYLMVHLGDGIIIGKSDNKVKAYSYPVNGDSNETFLTISSNIIDNTKVLRGFLGEFKKIVICSDGLYDFPLDQDFISNKLWDIVESNHLLKKEDDQGFIGLINGGSKDEVGCRHT